jgi:predicted KAP-like P-loop ATPase
VEIAPRDGCVEADVVMRLGLTDHPVERAEEDLLGRARYAELLAAEIRSLDARHGAVVGVLAPWGYGKTSLMNMVVERLSDEPTLPVVEFNPWLFSGTEQLVATFFEEMSAQLRVRQGRLEGIADELEAYGEALSPLRFVPVIGPWLDRVGSGSAALGRLVGRRSKARSSVSMLRKHIETKLLALDRPLVVLVDDLDRLTTPEIRDVFKLVRLTANFPSVIYLLAFDRQRVESALADDGMDGRAYLEKILQVAYELPAIPDEVLRRIFLENLQITLDGLVTGPFDEALWPDVFVECVWPLVNNLRDVKRYLAALPLTIRQLGENVAMVDAVAAEAFRMFLPETHALLPITAPALTSTRDLAYGRQDDGASRELESGGQHADVVRSFCARLFPASGRYLGGSTFGSDWLHGWARERRLAHPEVLTFYLDRVMSTAILARQRAEAAFSRFADEGSLRALFADWTPDDLEAAIADLEAYEPDYDPAAAVPACRALLDQLPRLRTEPRGMFDFGADLVVTRVVLRVLRRVEDENARLQAVKDIYEGVSTLHGKFILLTVVGHRENAGHKLVAEPDAAQLEADLRAEIAAAPPEHLAQERDLLRLLWWHAHPNEGAAPVVSSFRDPTVAEAVLRESLTYVRSQAMGSRAVRREPRLAWDSLIGVLGDEDAIRDVIDSVNVDGRDERLVTAVELAHKYLDGWRPSDFPE